MKRFREYLPLPLHISLPLSVLVCCMVFIVVNTLVLLHLGDNKELRDQALLGGKQVARLAKVASRASLEKKDQLNSHLEILASYSRVKWAGVCDERGVLVACTDESMAGKTVSDAEGPAAGAVVIKTLNTGSPHKDRISLAAGP